MSKENIRPESKIVENIGEVSGEPTAMQAALLVRELYEKLTTEEQTLLELLFQEFSGAEIAARLAIEPATARKRISRLSAKATEILKESALAHERITKDQEEIEQLRTETRALLAGLRAA